MDNAHAPARTLAARVVDAAPYERRRLDRKYLARSRLRGYGQVFGNVGIFFVFLILASNADTAWQGALLYFAIGCAQHRLFFPVHDCLHYSLFPAKLENVFFGTCLAPLIGTSFDAIRIQHMDHHRDFGKPEDPGASDYFVRFHSRGEFLAFLLGPLAGSIFFNKLGEYFLRPGKVAARKDTVHEEEWIFTSNIQSYGLILAIQAVICAVLTSGFQWSELWRYPVFYILPLITVFLFFNRLRMFAEHGSLDYEVCDYFEAKRPTARTIYASRIERIFLCGSSFNFHHEHHRYPSVSGWQLPALHRELASGIDPQDIRQTYLQALRELWKNLPAKTSLGVQR
jgi:fatty acid desaturase